TKGLMRLLIYPVQFEKDPKNGIERVIEFVIEEKLLSPAEYIAAIKLALNGAEELSALIPQPHSEAKIRDYLRELERALTRSDRKSGS
ncbi:MAG: hypothetical protein ABSE50_20795, partial [Xanthobacteraceae bacterium]